VQLILGIRSDVIFFLVGSAAWMLAVLPTFLRNILPSLSVSETDVSNVADDKQLFANTAVFSTGAELGFTTQSGEVWQGGGGHVV
jgi:hypothetical protein